MACWLFVHVPWNLPTKHCVNPKTLHTSICDTWLVAWLLSVLAMTCASIPSIAVWILWLCDTPRSHHQWRSSLRRHHPLHCTMSESLEYCADISISAALSDCEVPTKHTVFGISVFWAQSRAEVIRMSEKISGKCCYGEMSVLYNLCINFCNRIIISQRWVPASFVILNIFIEVPQTLLTMESLITLCL